jgi:endonuclease YncB( thermonuclease family)
VLLSLVGGAAAADCSLPVQGEGRVAAVVDARSLRLQDGREIRLAGIEPGPDGAELLTAMVTGREVTLRGTDDAPDRYGRQSALVFLEGQSVQAGLLGVGAALLDGRGTGAGCDAELAAAETAARKARRGLWSSAAIKSAEKSDEILALLGRFAVVEGKIVSVREAGATHYLNFGRRWTQDFAVTISRRVLASLAAAGIVPQALQRRRIRVRGWVEGREAPRIDVRFAGQIEVLDN